MRILNAFQTLFSNASAIIMEKNWFIPGTVAVAVYAVAINDFFVADDFIWLYRAKTLTNNPVQMLNPDVMYFDPLVYLSFFVNYKLGGTDPKFYHLVDLLIHAINATLVCRFAQHLSNDDKAGLYAGVVFASSFAIADAVLWTSSRVDLIAVMCSLGALIQFLKYLESDKLIFLQLSCLFFALALAAKGTPVALPLVLLWLAVNKHKSLRSVVSVLPYGLLIVGFFALLKLKLHNVSILPEFYLNLHNLSLSLCALFLPERHIEAMNPAVFTPILAIVILLGGFIKFLPDHAIILRRTGAVTLFCSILPMLALRNFKIAAPDQDAIALLASPSHRIYLASIGSALLIGGGLRTVEALFCRFFSAKFAPRIIAIFITGMVLFNAREVAKRDQQWEVAGKLSHAALDGLQANRNMIVEGGQVVLVNFPASPGFTAAMIKVYLDFNDITVLPRRSSIMVLDPPNVLKNQEKSALFVFGGDKRVYDFSEQFRSKLLCNMQMLAGHDEVDLISRKCESMTAALNEQIAAIIQ